MPVIGMNFTGLEAKRSDTPVKGEISVNSSPNIKDVKEIEMKGLGKNALTLDFEFNTVYNPDVGEIKISGNILFLTENISESLEKWKNDKTLPEDISTTVLNHLFRRCLVKVSVMADDLQLPPPIQLPLVKPTTSEEKKE